MENPIDFLSQQQPTASRPLLGMTILVVEDSRYTSETLRIMSLRSGARIRRADCLLSARRHLQVYRPSVVIVDMGLPDGSGLELITELSRSLPRVGVIIGMSGDDGTRENAMDAGADGFMAKPLDNVAQFQETILATLPKDRKPGGPRAVDTTTILPGFSAYRNDLAHVANILSGQQNGLTIGYAVQFLRGVARAAHDRQLEKAADDLAGHANDRERFAKVARLRKMLDDRLEKRAAV